MSGKSALARPQAGAISTGRAKALPLAGFTARIDGLMIQVGR